MITYEIAKKYVDYGFSVFPVNIWWDSKRKKYEKRPALKEWKPYQDRLPTDEELHDWFDKEKHNGLGLVTGKLSGVVVIDVEHDAKPEHVADLTSDLISETISGGKHFYYRWTKILSNTVKIRDMQIDFRGDGGFVVLPPSGIEESQYKWLKQCRREALVPLPLHLEQLLVKIPPKESNGLLSHLRESDSIFSPVEEGGRNNAATKVAGALLGRIPKDLWERAGWPALQAWNQSNKVPLPRQELRTTWESIKNSERVKQDKEPEVFVLSGKDAEKMWREKALKYGSGLSTGFNILDEHFTFLPPHVYLISAQTHVGKTTFALNMAGRVAMQGHKVLFASLEQGVFVVPRIKTMLNGGIPDSLFILDTADMVTIKKLTEIITNMEPRPELIVIDHLHFIQKEGKETADVDKMILDVQNKIAKALEIPTLVVSHLKKLNADRKPMNDDLRDSSMLAQVPSVLMFLYRPLTEDNIMKEEGSLIITKNRLTGKLKVLTFDMDNNGKMSFKAPEGKQPIIDPETVKPQKNKSQVYF